MDLPTSGSPVVPLLLTRISLDVLTRSLHEVLHRLMKHLIKIVQGYGPRWALLRETDSLHLSLWNVNVMYLKQSVKVCDSQFSLCRYSTSVWLNVLAISWLICSGLMYKTFDLNVGYVFDPLMSNTIACKKWRIIKCLSHE